MLLGRPTSLSREGALVAAATRSRLQRQQLHTHTPVLAVRDEAAAHAHLSLAALKADNERLVSQKEALGLDRDKALDAGAVLLEEKRGWQVRGEVVWVDGLD